MNFNYAYILNECVINNINQRHVIPWQVMIIYSLKLFEKFYILFRVVNYINWFIKTLGYPEKMEC